MKKAPYLITALVYFLLLYGCNSDNPKPTTTDSIPGKKITSIRREGNKDKPVAFGDRKMINKIKGNPKFYDSVSSELDILTLEDFDKFRDSFSSMLNLVNTRQSKIQFFPLPLSIYEKYNGFQKYLKLQSSDFPEAGKIFQNKIRVYPAIDANNIFYLVFMRETHDITAGTSSLPMSDTSLYYSLRYNKPYGATDCRFNPVAKIDTVQMAQDIKKFQSILQDIAANSSMTFRKERSFSYSIEQYNNLLNGRYPNWENMGSQQTNELSNVVIRIYPGIDTRNKNDVRFRLMLQLCMFTTNGYKAMTDKWIFDNMDPCPNVCPNPLTDIQKP
jgi:hypothetical protein